MFLANLTRTGIIEDHTQSMRAQGLPAWIFVLEIECW